MGQAGFKTGQVRRWDTTYISNDSQESSLQTYTHVFSLENENEEKCVERGPGNASLSLSGSANGLYKPRTFFALHKGWADKFRTEKKLYSLHLQPSVILRSNMDFPPWSIFVIRSFIKKLRSFFPNIITRIQWLLTVSYAAVTVYSHSHQTLSVWTLSF